MTSPVALTCAPALMNIRSAVVSVTALPATLVSAPSMVSAVALPPATVQPGPPSLLPVSVRLPETRL